jgi:hypothetical protein
VYVLALFLFLFLVILLECSSVKYREIYAPRAPFYDLAELSTRYALDLRFPRSLWDSAIEFFTQLSTKPAATTATTASPLSSPS